MKRFFIDRIEENIAVCEDESGDEFKFSIQELPNTATEGSVLIYDDNKFFESDTETLRRRKKILSLKENIYKTSSK
ncbi:MAG: DUF3006 domain-containing protein [Acutalibacteraceae bacterium]